MASSLLAFQRKQCRRNLGPFLISSLGRERLLRKQLGRNRNYCLCMMYHIFYHCICRRCSCGKCKPDRLVGALEFRCCTEVAEAGGKLTFEGREDIACIIEHEDYSAVTNEAVLTMTGPLLKDKNGRPYKRRAGISKNQYVFSCVCSPMHWYQQNEFVSWSYKQAYVGQSYK